MAKINIDYDKERDVLYFYEGKIDKTLNLALNEDVTFRIDSASNRAKGVIVTNFEYRYPKLVKLLGTKNEEFVGQFFSLFLREVNELKGAISKKNALRNFLLSEKVPTRRKIRA